MIIRVEDDYGDDVSVETETASREELAQACVVLNKQWGRLARLFDGRAEALDANGLDFRDTMKRTTLVMTDPEKAFAGFRRMLTESIEEEIDERRRAVEDEDAA